MIGGVYMMNRAERLVRLWGDMFQLWHRHQRLTMSVCLLLWQRPTPMHRCAGLAGY